MKHRINPFALVESMNLFCVLSDTSQNRVSSFALLVTQGKVHTIWTSLWLMGEDVLLHSRKPKRAGDAAYTRKQIRLVDGIQRKRPSQGVPSDPSPTRDSANLFLCCWDDLLSQELQIVICATNAGIGILKAGELSQGTMSWFQFRSLMATSVNGGQLVACAVSYTFWLSSRKVLRYITGDSDSLHGKIEMVLLSVVKVRISASLSFYLSDLQVFLSYAFIVHRRDVVCNVIKSS